MTDTHVNSSARDLRDRAQRLHQLAIDIEGASVLSLERHAGDDTWHGSRPLLCVNLLRTNQAQLHSAAEGLRRQAYVFEQRARELDRLSTLQAGRAS